MQQGCVREGVEEMEDLESRRGSISPAPSIPPQPRIKTFATTFRTAPLQPFLAFFIMDLDRIPGDANLYIGG